MWEWKKNYLYWDYEKNVERKKKAWQDYKASRRIRV